uniref:hypothetical protein n=1 Tax=uncultured Caulobacter sp. TaxID=158749 RepID=UPI0025FB42C4|nr:hypothetical protein [uncultured Caulobacter sp.]
MPGATRLTMSVSALALGQTHGAQTAAPKPEESLTIDTLVVTAQRREETANSVGMPIQAFSGEALQQLRVTDPKDLSTVGAYWDEVAYAYPFMNTGPIFDLERVEVRRARSTAATPPPA